MKLPRSLSPAVALLASAFSSFAQLTVTNDLQLWLRADAGVTTNAAGAVIQWDDQSTNANHATQVTEAQAPILVNAALNNRPVIRFDGADDFLNVLDSESLSFTGDLTTLFVIKFDDFVNYNAVWGKTAGPDGNLPAPTDLYTVPGSGFLRVYRGDGTFNNLSTVDSAQPLRVATYMVLGIDVAGETLTHYFNGQANGSGTVNTNTADANTDLKIGTRQDQFTRLKGDLAELLIYSRALSPTERSDAFNYLQTKYNLLNSAPTVTLSSTPMGPNVNVGDVIRLDATPIDLDGTIARVEFLANGVTIGTATAPPYSLNVTMDSAGSITFTARALDNKDASGTSNPVILTAGPAGPATLDVTAGLQLWLAADAGTSLGTGDAVVQWADQSGNANNAGQLDETMAPVLVADGVNGHPVLRFDGVNDFMDVPDSDSLSITGDITTFFVLKFANFATFRAVWAKTSGNLPAPTDFYALPNNGRLRLYRGNGTGTGIQFVDSSRPFAANTFLVAGFDQAGTAVTHYLGGAPNGTGAITVPMTDADTPLKIGTRADFVTRFAGDMAEMVIYDRALSAAERRSVQRYLAEKYALPGTFSVLNANPIVAVTSPMGVLQAPGTFTVTVDATDADGSIIGVQIFANGVLLANDTTAPYSATLDLDYGGQVVLTAIATDNFGARTTSASVTLCVQGPGAPAGLVGYWPLDGNADASLGVNGVLVNNPVPAPDRNAVEGGALAFNGAQLQRVEIPGGGGLSGATQGTIAMWVKWIGIQDGGFGGSFGAVLGRQRDGVFSADIINLNNVDPALAAVQWRHNSANATISGSTLVENDRWRHIAVTFTPSMSTLYVDGFLENSAAGGALRADTVTPLAIGAWTGGGGSYCTASIDDVAIWNRVLSTQEIQDLAAQFNTPLDLLLQPDCVTINNSINGVMVQWGSNAVLECAPELTGPWEELSSATSPYSVPAGPTQKFYRLRSR